MNIFFTSEDPTECAEFLDDKRVGKMLLESCQMLSTAVREHGYEGSDIYKSTHRNHPSNIWARQTRQNYFWLIDHAYALAEEFERRRGKSHKSAELLPTLEALYEFIPQGDLTPFANCAANKEFGLDFKHITPTTKAYRIYLKERWKNDKLKPKWS